MYIEVTRNCNRSVALVKLEATARAQDALTAACNKFRTKVSKSKLFHEGVQLDPLHQISDGSRLWLVGEAEVYQGPSSEQANMEREIQKRVTILDGADVWIDPEAVEQVHNTIRTSFDEILRAVGMPDLHHGPTGVAVLARRPLPKLPGYDIGCGMALFRTRIPASLSRDAVARRMARLDLDSGEDPSDPFLGTIGGGNHFAELLVVDSATPIADEVNTLLDPRHAVLLVHSGSRGHGERVFAAHSDGANPEEYMREHMGLVGWARCNRAVIARRFLRQFAAGAAGDAEADGGGGAEEEGGPEAVIDLAHNWIEELADGTFLHRKGAAPARAGTLSLLPGSRATASYVLACADDDAAANVHHLASLAHGAGRRLSRAAARRVGTDGGGAAGGDATRGGTVVCGDKALLAEEGAHAYKDVEGVVACMVARGMCRVAARLLPIATYKTRGPAL
jgi:release factor H-coupled RctB family protein